MKFIIILIMIVIIGIGSFFACTFAINIITQQKQKEAEAFKNSQLIPPSSEVECIPKPQKPLNKFPLKI